MMAGPGLTNAQTALTQQQTQGAAIANQQAQMQLGLFKQAVGRLQDFTGQGGTSTDASGVGATGAGAAPTDDIGSSAITDPGHLENTLRARYFVSPLGTPQQQAAVVAAMMSGNKGLADATVAQRDMSVNQRLIASQQDAQDHYNIMAAVVDADPNNAFAQLSAAAPSTAAQLKAQNPSATPDELDEIARDTAAHFAGAVHQYTGRELVKRDDGVYVDKQTSLPVPGVPVSGLSAQQYGELWSKANALVDVPQSDGSTKKETQFAADSYPNAASWIAQSAAQAHAAQQGPHPAAVAVGKQIAQQRITQAVQNPPQPNAAQHNAPQPNADNGLLPGVNPDALPKFSPGPVVSGQTPGDVQKATMATYSAQRKAAMDSVIEDQKNTAKTNALLAQAQNEVQKINPRDVGPGSGVVKEMQNAYTAISGKAPDALVDRAVLDKFLNMVGAQNVRNLLAGQRITNQEMMLFMTRGSPNIDQPKAALQNLLGYLRADNDYTARLARTQAVALSRGADPSQLSGALEIALPRATYVQKVTGMQPTTQTSGPATYKAASDVKAAFQNGTLSRAQAKQILSSQFGMQ
jgi:hypothetical protein